MDECVFYLDEVRPGHTSVSDSFTEMPLALPLIRQPNKIT